MIAMFTIAAGMAQQTSFEKMNADALVVDLPSYGTTGTYFISGKINKQLNGIVNSTTVCYSIDNGSSEALQIDQQTLTQETITAFKFESPVYLHPGSHTIRFWLSEVNGISVSHPEVISKEVHIASRAATRNGLIELFNSSTNFLCMDKYKTLDPLLVKNNANTAGRLNVIRYQMNWPGSGNDPSYNAHGESRKIYYGITTLPQGRVNGVELPYNSQADLDASKLPPATVDIAPTLLVSGNQIQAKATITPYVSSTVTVHQVLVQEHYTYKGENNQAHFHFVMRKMNPDGDGAKNIHITDGVPFDVTFDHTATETTQPAQGSFDFWISSSIEYQYVVFVQDDKTKEVLNSGSGVATTTGIVPIKEDAQMGVYPNPAKDYAVIGLKLQTVSDIALQIYDVTGKSIYNNEAQRIAAGKNEIGINTSRFAPGIYTIVINTGNAILRDKLVIR